MLARNRWKNKQRCKVGRSDGLKTGTSSTAHALPAIGDAAIQYIVSLSEIYADEQSKANPLDVAVHSVLVPFDRTNLAVY